MESTSTKIAITCLAMISALLLPACSSSPVVYPQSEYTMTCKTLDAVMAFPKGPVRDRGNLKFDGFSVDLSVVNFDESWCQSTDHGYKAFIYSPFLNKYVTKDNVDQAWSFAHLNIIKLHVFEDDISKYDLGSVENVAKIWSSAGNRFVPLDKTITKLNSSVHSDAEWAFLMRLKPRFTAPVYEANKLSGIDNCVEYKTVYKNPNHNPSLSIHNIGYLCKLNNRENEFLSINVGYERIDKKSVDTEDMMRLLKVKYLDKIFKSLKFS